MVPSVLVVHPENSTKTHTFWRRIANKKLLIRVSDWRCKARRARDDNARTGSGGETELNAFQQALLALDPAVKHTGVSAPRPQPFSMTYTPDPLHGDAEWEVTLDAEVPSTSTQSPRVAANIQSPPFARIHSPKPSASATPNKMRGRKRARTSPCTPNSVETARREFIKAQASAQRELNEAQLEYYRTQTALARAEMRDKHRPKRAHFMDILLRFP